MARNKFNEASMFNMLTGIDRAIKSEAYKKYDLPTFDKGGKTGEEPPAKGAKKKAYQDAITANVYDYLKRTNYKTPHVPGKTIDDLGREMNCIHGVCQIVEGTGAKKFSQEYFGNMVFDDNMKKEGFYYAQPETEGFEVGDFLRFARTKGNANTMARYSGSVTPLNEDDLIPQHTSFILDKYVDDDGVTMYSVANNHGEEVVETDEVSEEELLQWAQKGKGSFDKMLIARYDPDKVAEDAEKSEKINKILSGENSYAGKYSGRKPGVKLKEKDELGEELLGYYKKNYEKLGKSSDLPPEVLDKLFVKQIGIAKQESTTGSRSIGKSVVPDAMLPYARKVADALFDNDNWILDYWNKNADDVKSKFKSVKEFTDYVTKDLKLDKEAREYLRYNSPASKGMFQQKELSQRGRFHKSGFDTPEDQFISSMDLAIDNYHKVKDKYPDMFEPELVELTTLMHNSPFKALTPEYVNYYLKNQDIDYVNKVNKYIPAYEIDRPIEKETELQKFIQKHAKPLPITETANTVSPEEKKKIVDFLLNQNKKKEYGGELESFQDGGEDPPYKKLPSETTQSQVSAYLKNLPKSLKEMQKREELKNKSKTQEEPDFIDKLYTTLNPYNWNVANFDDYNLNFTSAYHLAKNEGLDEFMFKGKRYSTKDSGKKKENWEYAEKQGEDFFKNYLKNHLKKLHPNDYEKRYKDVLDLHYKYGNPLVNIGEALFDSEGDFARAYFNPYYNKETIYGYNQDFKQKQIDTANLVREYVTELLHSRQLKDLGKEAYEAHNDEDYKRNNIYYDKEKKKWVNYDEKMYSDPLSLEYVHEEQEGSLMQRMLNRDYDLESGIGDVYKNARADYLDNPFVVNDFKPYKKQEYIRTIQRALAEKGYDMSGSLKKDGTYDGIFGTESKKALEDYKTKRQKQLQDNLMLGPNVDFESFKNGGTNRHVLSKFVDGGGKKGTEQNPFELPEITITPDTKRQAEMAETYKYMPEDVKQAIAYDMENPDILTESPEEQSYLSRGFDAITHPFTALNELHNRKGLQSNWLALNQDRSGPNFLDWALYGAAAARFLPQAVKELPKYLSSSLPGMSKIPGATLGNALASEMIVNSALRETGLKGEEDPSTIREWEKYNEGSQDLGTTIANTGWNAMDALAFGELGPLKSQLAKDAQVAGEYLTTKTPLRGYKAVDVPKISSRPFMESSFPASVSTESANFDLFDLNNVKKASGSIGNQGATPEGARDILKSIGIEVKTANPKNPTFKEMVEHLKNTPEDAIKYQKFLEKEPIEVFELPGGEYSLKDGHHRATLAYYSGNEKIPAIIKNKGEYTKLSNALENPYSINTVGEGESIIGEAGSTTEGVKPKLEEIKLENVNHRVDPETGEDYLEIPVWQQRFAKDGTSGIQLQNKKLMEFADKPKSTIKIEEPAPRDILEGHKKEFELAKEFGYKWAMPDPKETFNIKGLLEQAMQDLDISRTYLKAKDSRMAGARVSQAELNQFINTERPILEQNIKNNSAKVDELQKMLYSSIDPEFKRKVRNLMTESGVVNTEALELPFHIDHMDPNRATLVNILNNDKGFANLSSIDKDYVIKNYPSFSGVRTEDAAITIGTRPSNYESAYVRVPVPKNWEPGQSGNLTAADVDLSNAQLVRRTRQDYPLPESVGRTTAHEVGHDLQKYFNWDELIVEHDPAYKYFVNKDDTNISRLFKESLVDPTPAVDGKKTYETWKASGMELHSDLMMERYELAKSIMEQHKVSLNTAIDHVKYLERIEDPTVINYYLQSPDISKHFKETTTDAVKKQIIKILPAAALAVLGTGAALSSEDKKKLPENKFEGNISNLQKFIR